MNELLRLLFKNERGRDTNRAVITLLVLVNLYWTQRVDERLTRMEAHETNHHTAALLSTNTAAAIPLPSTLDWLPQIP